MEFPEETEQHFQKLYRGAYNYFRNSNIYSEETFEVFKDRKEHNLIFNSSLHSRVATGELLIIKVRYVVNKDYVPIDVQINKTLGEDTTEESFEYETRKNRLMYTFVDKEGEMTEIELNTSPKFQIATPATAPSMLFIRSKKFDGTGKNIYQSWTSENHWEFEKEPQIVNLALEKVSQGFESLVVDGQNLQSVEYKLYENTFDENEAKGSINEQKPILKIFLSKHITIPYLIRDQEGTKIEVKYLNDLE